MTSPGATRERLAFLLETVRREAEHLRITDQRLFAEPFGAERAARLQADVGLAEQLDAFGARFARLQDTAGDKPLSTLLSVLGEPVGSTLDDLDRAARLGLLAESSETWVAARALRKRMVHEYIRDASLLAQAVNEGHDRVPMLLRFVQACRDYAEQRRLA